MFDNQETRCFMRIYFNCFQSFSLNFKYVLKDNPTNMEND